jgi:hypothetical protein
MGRASPVFHAYSLVWTRTLNGRELPFHLADINNQSFLMHDEETGSYWQRVTGAAIAGPLQVGQLTWCGTTS